MNSELSPSPTLARSSCGQQGPEVVGGQGCCFKEITTRVHLVEIRGEGSLQDLHLGGGAQGCLGTSKPGSLPS